MGHSLSRRWSLTKSCDYRKYGKNRKTDTSISNVAQHEGQRRGNRAGVYFFPWIVYIRQGFFSLPWGFLILLDLKFRSNFKTLLGRYKCYLEENFCNLAKVKYLCCVFWDSRSGMRMLCVDASCVGVYMWGRLFVWRGCFPCVCGL